MAVLLAGLVVLAVGLGLGPAHAAEEGLGAAAVAGVALAVVGAGAVVWAVVRLLGSSRRRWWTLQVPAVLLVAYLVLWTVGYAVAAAFPPRPALADRTPADVGLVADDVAFPAGDGVRLAGWWVPSRNGAAVAVLHGAGSTRTDVLEHAAALADHGYGVLLPDARGHGESGGRAMELGWHGEADVAGAVDFLLAQPEVDPGRVGLLGLSMGGEEAIGAAGVDDRVAAVVAEGATARVADDRAYLSAYGLQGEVQQRLDRLAYGLAGLLSRAPEPTSLRVAVVRATSRPDPTRFLLVAAGKVEDEQLAAEQVRGAATGVDTWTVQGADHTGALTTDRVAWEDRVVGFLDAALAAGAGPPSG